MKYLLILLSILALPASAIDVMTVNTEFFWDDKAPHEGQIMNASKAPSKNAYIRKKEYFSNLIRESGVSIVGLTEIEGCHIASDLAEILNWNFACKKGRDIYTGQDVAVLTKFKVLSNTIDNHAKSYAPMKLYNGGSKEVRPSKALTVILLDDQDSIMVTVAHLISRRGSNDDKRHAQANAIFNTLLKTRERHKPKYEFLMGDFNDVASSETLRIMQSDVLINKAGSEDWSYQYKGHILIDHILVSKNLQEGDIETLPTSMAFTDHQAVIFRH